MRIHDQALTCYNGIVAVKLVAKKGSTFHDFPYSSPERKCLHCWIVNITPAGPNQCIHDCTYCYAREAIYSNYAGDMLVYDNLLELVDKDLRKLTLCPPISLSNISDPCQEIPELRKEVKRLVELLIDYGVSFFITTKGDPSFLLELPGFIEYKTKFVAMTIEGTADVLRLLSPGAPPFDARVATASKLSRMGMDIVIRLDPVFIHLFQALYGDCWLEEVERTIDIFAGTGAKHVIASTGRLSKKRSPSGGRKGTGTWQRIYNVISSRSPLAARRFEQEYLYEAHWSGGGYRLRKHLRFAFHRNVREFAEARGMTYATCQELSADDSDSAGIPSCEGLPLPFSRKRWDGRFVPIPGCTANCQVSCRDLLATPCGQAALIGCEPLRLGKLRIKPAILTR
jgi:DNA repair photolyase